MQHPSPAAPPFCRPAPDRQSALCRFIALLILLLAAGLPAATSAGQAAEAGPNKDAPLAANSFTRNPDLPAWANLAASIPEADTSSAVVMRLAETRFRIAERPQVLLRRVLQVNDASGLAGVGQNQILFQPDYQQVVLHAARILRGGQVIDKLATINVRFVQRESNDELAVFTGWVAAVIVVDDLRVGDSVELTYSIVGDNPVYRGQFFDSATWDAMLPVRRRIVAVDAPRDRKIHYRLIGAGEEAGLTPRETLNGDRRILSFEGRDLPPIDLDPYIPADAAPLRWLQFSEFRDWHEVTRWATDLFPTVPLPAVFDPLLADLRHQPNDVARVMKALAFVQNDIRYLSMSLGENSHRPFAPATVFERRYGDCKDKSLLLVSLLNQSGIRAVPVLLSTQNRKNLATLLPSPLDFNHVIVRVTIGQRDYYLDPTLRDQVGSPDVLGQAHGDTLVLAVEPGGGKLERIPPADDALITDRRFERVAIDRLDQPATLEVRLEYAGLTAESLRGSFASLRPAQIHKHYAGALDRRYRDAELIGEPRMRDDRSKNRLTVELSYRLPQLVGQDGDGWFVPYQANNLAELFNVPNNSRRTQPLALPAYPMIGEYEFELTLPENVEAFRQPVHRSLGPEQAKFTQDLSMKGRTARARVSLRLLTDRIEAPEVPRFLEDLRYAGSLIKNAFGFDKGDLKITRQTVPFKQATREMLERAVQGASKTITDARLSGRDLAGAYCERALAQSYLGNNREARADAAEALRRLPNGPDTLKCHGTVEYLAGNLAAGQADFSRAIVLGLADADTRFKRGLAAYYLASYRDAAEDFEAARQTADSPTTAARAEYWRLLSLRQAGVTAGSPVLASDAWPAPAIRALTGAATNAEVLEKAHENSGSALELALMEAYFYLGQQALLRGERFKANAYFKQAAEKEALHSILHHSIARERARLTP